MFEENINYDAARMSMEGEWKEVNASHTIVGNPTWLPQQKINYVFDYILSERKVETSENEP